MLLALVVAPLAIPDATYMRNSFEPYLIRCPDGLLRLPLSRRPHCCVRRIIKSRVLVTTRSIVLHADSTIDFFLRADALLSVVVGCGWLMCSSSSEVIVMKDLVILDG